MTTAWKRPESFTPIVTEPSHPILQGFDANWPNLLGFNEVKPKRRRDGARDRLAGLWRKAAARRRDLWRGPYARLDVGHRAPLAAAGIRGMARLRTALASIARVADEGSLVGADAMIHVVGNAAIDTILSVERFPKPGETIVATESSDDLGGKGANQAIMIARSGVRVQLVAAIGEDAEGRRIRRALDAEGVEADGLMTGFGPTDRCVISVDAQGENTVVSLIQASRAFDPVASDVFSSRIASGDWVVMQGNLRPEVTRACLALARARDGTTVLNPSPLYGSPDYDWGCVDIAVLNRGEAAAVSGIDDPVAAAKVLLAAGAGAVVVTLGPEGAILVSVSDMLQAAAPHVKALDTTGAGDVFCGALVAARSTGRTWREALEAAAHAAALSVQRYGVRAAFPTRGEMAAILPNGLVAEHGQ